MVNISDVPFAVWSGWEKDQLPTSQQENAMLVISANDFQ
jgi:hypothetical protein